MDLVPAGRKRVAARAQRKADTVAHDLLTRVVAGELPVGSILPREADLAAKYDVNRSVVREAVKLLEVHRLVEPTRRRGTEVLDPLRSLSPEVLRAMLRHDGRVDRKVLEGLLEVRAAIDVEMTMRAAARRTDDDLRALDALVARVRAARADEELEQVRRDLPVLIARATQNPIFEMLAHWNDLVVRDLDDLFRWVRPIREAYVQGIELLVERIRARDVESIRGLVTTFHAWSAPRLLAAAALSSGDPMPSQENAT